MQRFFVEPYQVLEEEHRITLTGPDLNHMKNVLRMRIGEEVWISDGSEKEYHCTIEEFQHFKRENVNLETAEYLYRLRHHFIWQNYFSHISLKELPLLIFHLPVTV